MHSPLRLIVLIAVAPWFALTANTSHAGGAYEHVVNGGFEDGIAPWSALPGSTLSGVAGEAFDGSMSARIDSPQGAPTVRQTLSGLSAPGAYEFTGAVRADTAAVMIDVTLRLNSSETFQFQIDAVPDHWHRFGEEFAFAAATSGGTLTLAARAPAASFFVDAVTLTGPPPAPLTPTPSTTPLGATPGTLPATPAPATALATPSTTATAIAMEAITPHLRNRGFEDTRDGVPASWAKFGGTISSVENPVHGGAHSARLESATSSTKWLYQTVLVDAGSTYAFDAWLLVDDANVAAAWLRISWYASEDGSGESLGSSDSVRLASRHPIWRHLATDPVTAPSSARSARLRAMLAPVSSAPASIYVDDATWGHAAPLAMPQTPIDNNTAVVNQSPNENISSRSSASATHAIAARIVESSIGSANSIVINEVLYDPNSDGPDPANEWVELFNASAVPVDLNGWALQDARAAEVLPPIVLEPQSFLVIAASDSFFDSYPDYTGAQVTAGGRIGNGLGNDGDQLMLLDVAGIPVDAVSWGDNNVLLSPPVEDVPAGHSIERGVAGVDSNSAYDFIDNESPTPGRAIQIRRSGSPPQPGSIEILRSAPQTRFAWLPWVVVGASAGALASTLGWRAWGMARTRTHAQ